MNRIFFLLIFIGFSQVYSQSDIFDASRKGQLNEVISIYSKNPEVINLTNTEGYSPLILACYHGNEEVVRFILDKANNINGTSNYGTPLMAAVVKGNLNIVEMLLERKADTNIADSNGTTAMHYAVMFKNYDVIKLLLEAKADLKIKDNRGQSALDYAAIYNDKKLNNLLKNI
ncbi:MAG: ankyrin repeat domain-containing protein [Flavobacteriaceae bacterium]|nr:ankyrin repeat domain-containing protein [Flavobacteriaceae bacterium]